MEAPLMGTRSGRGEGTGRPDGEEEISSDTENRNDHDVFRCGKCETCFQSSYQLHHHIAYHHMGIALETSDKLANPYPVEPLALNLKHTNQVDSQLHIRSRESSPLSRNVCKGMPISQNIALDLSKAPTCINGALDLSTNKPQKSFKAGEATAYKQSQGQVTPSSNGYLNVVQGWKESQSWLDVRRDMVNSRTGDMNSIRGESMLQQNPTIAKETAPVVDSSNSVDGPHNRMGNDAETAELNSHVTDYYQTFSTQDEGRRPGNHEGHKQSHDQPSEHQGQGQPAVGTGMGMHHGGLPFPFSLQQQMTMANVNGALPPATSYSTMSQEMQQSLFSYQQQMTKFLDRKSGPIKAPKVSRRSRVKDADPHSDKNKNVIEIYECKICNRKFSQVGNFHNHMKLHSTKICVCGICKVEFLDSYELQRHMRKTHTGDMPYKCEQCNREFSQYNNLRRHLRVHNGKSYKCHICGRTFNEVFYLEMHIGSHTGERTYSCGVCNLSFRDNAELQRHVQTHSAAELHTCEVCGKSFSKACVLRQHRKMHSGLRPFKCDICDKAFIHRHHLKIHSRMHSTDKPYRCKICGKDFAQTSHLYKHVRQHALPNNDDDADVRTQAEIQALYPGFCQSSRGSPSPLTTSCVSDLSQSSGSPVNSPRRDMESHAMDTESEVPMPSSPGMKYSSITEDSKNFNNDEMEGKLSDNIHATEYVAHSPHLNNDILKTEYMPQSPNLINSFNEQVKEISTTNSKCDDGAAVHDNASDGETMDKQTEELKSHDENGTSDTLESDPDTEEAELSPPDHEAEENETSVKLESTVGEYGPCNRQAMSELGGHFPNEHTESHAPGTEHFRENTEETCGKDHTIQVTPNTEVKTDGGEHQTSGCYSETRVKLEEHQETGLSFGMRELVSGDMLRLKSSGSPLMSSDHTKQKYSIDQLLRNPSEDELSEKYDRNLAHVLKNPLEDKLSEKYDHNVSHDGAQSYFVRNMSEREIFERKYGMMSKTDQFHHGIGNDLDVCEAKNILRLHSEKYGEDPEMDKYVPPMNTTSSPSQHSPVLDSHRCSPNISSHSQSQQVVDCHLSSRGQTQSVHDFQLENSMAAGFQGQGHLDRFYARLSESASPIGSDRLSTISSAGTEYSRSRSSSLESEGQRSRSYMELKHLKKEQTMQEDVTSSTDDHAISNSNARADYSEMSIKSAQNIDYRSSNVQQHSKIDSASSQTKQKQKRRRREKTDKITTAEQSYLPLVPNLGIDPQQMYLLQLHQMQMVMAASMAAGGSLYPFPGNGMMANGNPMGNFENGQAFSPDSSYRRHFENRERSRSQSPQVSRSHDFHRPEKSLSMQHRSFSPMMDRNRHSGSPSCLTFTPSEMSRSPREEMKRYMLSKPEVVSNGHS